MLSCSNEYYIMELRQKKAFLAFFCRGSVQGGVIESISPTPQALTKRGRTGMTIDNDDILNSILASLDRVNYISPEDIPNIDLYMDQVTTFIDSRLQSSARYPGEDKILTKTMINNYAKNDLLPPPVKKKYSREHVMLLVFIYYYKGILSINDIQTLLKPITERYFQNGQAYDMERIYREAFGMEDKMLQSMKADIEEKFKVASEAFQGAPQEDTDFLHMFAFICLLGFDVYLKKLMIEKMIDELAANRQEQGKKKAHKAQGEEE